jgi:hypothetical protein
MKNWLPIAYCPARGRRIQVALYGAWTNMRRRTRTDHPAYFRWYKAKGITFCAEWHDYATFREWAITNGYRKGLWLERVNGDGNYEPGNCCWTTRDAQMLNQRHVYRLTLNGVTKPLPLWARELGFSTTLLRSRLKEGWTHEQVLTTPKLASGYMRPGVPHKPRGRAAQKAKRLAQQAAQ